jgi:hypothetical protein
VRSGIGRVAVVLAAPSMRKGDIEAVRYWSSSFTLLGRFRPQAVEPRPPAKPIKRRIHVNVLSLQPLPANRIESTLGTFRRISPGHTYVGERDYGMIHFLGNMRSESELRSDLSSLIPEILQSAAGSTK